MSENSSDWLHRSQILFGQQGIAQLRQSHVLLAGAGGVGGYAAEALARSGIGALTVFDPDRVHITNLNRQLLALHSTLDKYKTDVLRERLLDINPALQLATHACALTRENIPEVLRNGHFDYIIDAIDSVDDKCFLLAEAYAQKIPVISAMGAGRRVDPCAVQYADISKTYNCKLAKIVRGKLKKEYLITRGIECVFSSEQALQPTGSTPGADSAGVIGSCAFLPGISGLYLAARVIGALSKTQKK